MPQTPEQRAKWRAIPGNREKERVWKRKSYQKNKEKILEYQHEFNSRPENKLRKKQTGRAYYLANKERVNARNNAYSKQKYVEARKLLGGCCFLCKGDWRLSIHEKNGNKHHVHVYKDVFKNPDRFVLLCQLPCHKFVHRCMSLLKMTWKEIEGRLKL